MVEKCASVTARVTLGVSVLTICRKIGNLGRAGSVRRLLSAVSGNQEAVNLGSIHGLSWQTGTVSPYVKTQLPVSP